MKKWKVFVCCKMKNEKSTIIVNVDADDVVCLNKKISFEINKVFGKTNYEILNIYEM